jgi:hypothetical protein
MPDHVLVSQYPQVFHLAAVVVPAVPVVVAPAVKQPIYEVRLKPLAFLVRGFFLPKGIYFMTKTPHETCLQNGFVINRTLIAWMVELVDTRDLKSRDPCGRASSILAPGTTVISRDSNLRFESLFL